VGGLLYIRANMVVVIQVICQPATWLFTNHDIDGDDPGFVRTFRPIHVDSGLELVPYPAIPSASRIRLSIGVSDRTSLANIRIGEYIIASYEGFFFRD
jgi:hypothetical protein